VANDLDEIILLIVGILGGLVALLFLLAWMDPQTDKKSPAQPKPQRSRRDQ
jgi:hypothetical protein